MALFYVQHDQNLGWRIYNWLSGVLGRISPTAKGREAAFIRRARSLYAKALRQTMADEASTAKGDATTYQRAKSQLDADLRNGLISDEEYDAALNDVMRYGQWEELDRPMSEAEFEAQMEKGEEKQGQYSIKKTSKMDYAEQLRQIENKNMNGSNSLYIGKPSEALQKAGLSEHPFAMNQGDYRKSRRNTANNEKYSAHGVPFDFFENMPKYIAEAPMLIDNGKKTSVVTAYGMKDKKGNDSFVIAGVWRNETIETDDVNQVKSVYPLDDFVDQIKKSAENEKLVVINKNKAEEMLKTIGIQSAEVSRILNLAKSRLSQDPNDVNNQFSFYNDPDEAGYWQSLNRARFERDSAQFQRTQEEVVQENENEADWESRLEEAQKQSRQKRSREKEQPKGPVDESPDRGGTIPQFFASQNPVPLIRRASYSAARIHKTAL